MTETEYANPLVAGFGTATAEDPPFPAQEHLDATGGHKTPPINVAEQAPFAQHRVNADGTEADNDDGDDDGASPEDAIADGDYKAKGVTVPLLQAEIDRRNEDREEDDQLPREGKKGELIAALEADDVAADESE